MLCWWHFGAKKFKIAGRSRRGRTGQSPRGQTRMFIFKAYNGNTVRLYRLRIEFYEF